MGSSHRKRYRYNYETKEMELIEDVRPTFGVLVAGDLPDFVSPVDGSIVHGRAGLREHDKRNGTTNVADYKETWRMEAEKRAAVFEGRDRDPRRTEAAVRAFNDLKEGRHRPRPISERDFNK